VLVPDKYNVYQPLLRDAPAAPESQSPLDHLEEDLIHSDVPVVNLIPALRLQAAEGLRNSEYDYLIDDTHWNRLGIRVAANAIYQRQKSH
jgi:hypothetical protein